MNLPLKGIIPPLVTPLTDDGKLDVAGLERVLEHMIAGGVHGIFALGTTGEFASLSESLKRELVAQVTRQVAGRVPVLVGVTHPSEAEALSLAAYAADAGADGLVLSTPYYFPIQQDDLAAYFEKLAPQMPVPVVIYSIPSFTKVTIEPPTVQRLVQTENIIGIKDSAGDMIKFHQLISIAAQRADWTVLMGPEELSAEAVLMGGHGAIPGGGNLCPRLHVSLYEAAARQDVARVRQLQAEVLNICNTLYKIGAPGSGFIKGIKSALRRLGICHDAMASPFTGFGEADTAKVIAILDELGITAERPWPAKALL